MKLDLFRRFLGDRRANVAIIFAIASVPTIYLLGMGLDFSSAVRRQSQLDAAADAAAAMQPNTTSASRRVRFAAKDGRLRAA